MFKFPPIAHSLNVKKYFRETPFNKEIIKAVKRWEKETGIKFNGKIHQNNEATFYYPKRTINLNSSDLFTLYHELTHFGHGKTGTPISDKCKSFYLWFCEGALRSGNGEKVIERYNHLYFMQPHERLANSQAKKLYLKTKNIKICHEN